MPRQPLPVGSVVRLEGASALVMVMGYQPQVDGGMADYLAVPYPMGLMSDDAALAFDAGAVADVVHRGYWDDEGDAAVAAVRRYRDAADDLATQFEAFVETLTPERVRELHDEYAFDALGEEPEPDFLEAFEGLDDEPEPDFPDGGGLL